MTTSPQPLTNELRKNARAATTNRAQFILIAAGVVAIALAAVLGAYLQLGYAADIRTAENYDHPVRETERSLARAVDNASQGIPHSYGWPERRRAIQRTRDQLDRRRAAIGAARIDDGIVTELTYNRTAARRWAAHECPSGSDRQFGACEAHRGIVVQQRAGRTHVLAVAFDLRIATAEGHSSETIVVLSVGGVARDA